MKKKKWFKRPLCIWIMGLIFVQLFIGTTFARYASGGGDEEAVRAAGFSVAAKEVSGQTVTDLSLLEKGAMVPYEFLVSNDGETAVSYDIMVNLNGTKPEYLEVSLEGYAEEAVWEGSVLLFKNAGFFEAGSNCRSHKLFFCLEELSETVVTLDNVRIDVCFTQID